MKRVKVYRRLCAQMALRGVSARMLASGMGMNYETLRQKLNGEHGFTLEEALRAKRLLEYDETVEKLFERAV